MQRKKLCWAQGQNLDIDDAIPIRSSQDGIRVETFTFVENEATIETNFSSTCVYFCTKVKEKKGKRKKAKYDNIVSK